MTSKTLVVLDHIITMLNKKKKGYDDRDEYNYNEHYDWAVASCVNEIKNFKKLLVDMGVEK